MEFHFESSYTSGSSPRRERRARGVPRWVRVRMLPVLQRVVWPGILFALAVAFAIRLLFVGYLG